MAMEADPIAAILNADEFGETRTFFGRAPSVTRSLLTDVAQALLYATVRNLRPDHVVEIGTYKGGTAETLSRAIQANGSGMLHTVSPFDAERFGPIFQAWPQQLRAVTQYYPVNSMEFFIRVPEKRIRPGVVLVDGNHDYEFAAFDIQSAARWITPGGFIFVDNVSQAGPCRAASDFLAAHPAWRDCGTVAGSRAAGKAFDHGRSRVPYADFYILRAPPSYVVGSAPETFGEIGWDGQSLAGLRLVPATAAQKGVLSVQCVLRALSETKIIEIQVEVVCEVDGQAPTIAVNFDAPRQIEPGFTRYSVEPWLCWTGDKPLALKELPTLL